MLVKVGPVENMVGMGNYISHNTVDTLKEHDLIPGTTMIIKTQ